MPPQNGSEKSNWTTPKVVAVVATAAAAAALIGGALALTLDGGDDEERPPVIVNNGSIEFRPSGGFLGLGDRGNWNATGNQFKHDHKNREPRTLRVEANTSQRVCRLKNGVQVKPKFTADTVTITYGDDNTKQSATVSIDSGYLQVDFGDNAPYHDGNARKLVAYRNNSGVRIYSLVGDGDAITCTFTQDTKLEISQKY